MLPHTHPSPAPTPTPTPTPTIGVVVAAKHPTVRRHLGSLMTHQAGLRVVATAVDAREAARCALQHHPDVLVLAVPGALHEDGALIRELRTLSPQSAVVIAATAFGKAYRSVAETAGAAALVALDGPPENLVAAVRAAARHS